jgi:erythronate-4-phosphate dehydrogenase
VDTDALIAAMRNGIVAHAIVDTWEGEPAYRLDLLRLATIATPHIAGYSYDGRVNGTVMIYQAACRHFGVTPEWTAGSQLPTAPLSSISLAPDAPAGLSALHDIVRRVYDISADDADLRAGAHEDARRRADAFDRLRKTYRDRREFPFTRIDGSPPPALRAALAGLGFPLRAM